MAGGQALPSRRHGPVIPRGLWLRIAPGQERCVHPVFMQNGSTCTGQPPGGGLPPRCLGLKECRWRPTAAQGLVELAS